ncbi:DUF2179 domain-containing protein [Aliifodinibius sp. S!AR15-10]|uniref:DUF2179 domain-containing protein n=1 Tax=Aliifodinibius sp. S!AR15-10 TaxID=2950437 RepID=UPI00285CABD6|nr:DUF2179 domain-containing protein [Aliifodinibius sp. S!AR15-10]MDR8394055.1 DUF2179 domain-containing protein [Aliifodinibius sp. S!AR15-10]
MLLSSLPEYWVPVIIFFARICDVSMGTIRIIFISRGMKIKAALLGFVEVLIWIMVVTQLIQHLDYWVNYIAFAGGFAAGNYMGITLENKLKVGTVITRVITNKPANILIEQLKEAGFMITRLDAYGGEGPVEIIFMIVKRKRLSEAVQIIESFDADAFYSVEDVKYSSGESTDKMPFPMTNRSAFDRLLRVRKGI